MSFVWVGDASLDEVAPTYSSFTSSNTFAVSIEKIHYDVLAVCTGLDATPLTSIPTARLRAKHFIP